MRKVRHIVTMIALLCISAILTFAENTHVSVIDSLKNNLELANASKQHDETYRIATQIIEMADSVYKAQLDTMINRTNTKMGLDKIQSENEAIHAQMKLWIYISIAATLMAVIIVIGLYHKRSSEKRAILNSQKEILESEVKRQMEIITETTQSLTDSIAYAQHIQEAILPTIGKLTTSCGITGAFSFYHPLNIVSGDFYWAETRNDEMIVACADCTGHGVPGAFMSLIGTTLLNDICSEMDDWDPGRVLTELDNRLLEILSMNNYRVVQDGMDIAIVAYTSGTHRLRMASARRPIHLFKDDKHTELKGTKRSIGDQEEFRLRYTFETTELTIKEGDTIYLSSDGLADQFGGQEHNGEKGRKLMNSGATRLFCELYPLSIEDQEAELANRFSKWKGTCMQVDDVSVVGIRF